MEAGLQQDVLLKAIGKKRKGLVILDATAGFGHDALRMAAGGHRVTALERDPVPQRPRPPPYSACKLCLHTPALAPPLHALR